MLIAAASTAAELPFSVLDKVVGGGCDAILFETTKTLCFRAVPGVTPRARTSVLRYFSSTMIDRTSIAVEESRPHGK